MSDIRDRDIVFVTTSLYTKWLDYQSNIIKKLFPGSKHVIVDGRSNWPNSWFDWIEIIENRKEKYYVHMDEDFFYNIRKRAKKSNRKHGRKKNRSSWSFRWFPSLQRCKSYSNKYISDDRKDR